MNQQLFDIITKLCSYSNRAVASNNGKEILDELSSFITHPASKINYQGFKTPYHFLQVSYWVLAGFAISLCIVAYSIWIASLITLIVLVGTFLYFDWRSSFLTKLPPQIPSYNFIVSKPIANAKQKIVLMAHWDTAPITVPYRPALIKNLRSSIRIQVVVMVIITLFILIYGWIQHLAFIGIIKWALLLYLLIQFIILVADFWKYGYSNGANDNATGCAVAIALYNELCQQEMESIELELCITGAEEVGHIGSKCYFDSLKKSDIPVSIINFDTLGCEQLQVVTNTGIFSGISYDNDLLALAKGIAKTQDLPIEFAPYHTADLDTVWFARAGISCLSIISKGKEGVPSYIHRPEDTLDKLNWDTILLSKHFGSAIVNDLVTSEK